MEEAPDRAKELKARLFPEVKLSARDGRQPIGIMEGASAVIDAMSGEVLQ